MEKQVEERFERIEGLLERIAAAHLELEAAQLNTQKAHDRLSAKVEGVTEQISNLAILVDQLIKKDFDR